MARRRTRLILFAVLVLLIAAGAFAREYVRGGLFVVQAAGLEGWPARVAGWAARPVAREDLTVPTRHGEVRARSYRPEGGVRRWLVMVPGVHAAGIDEPRLVGFAGDLAAHGLAVLAVQLPDLAGYEITVRTTDMIEDAAVWATQGGGPAGGQRAGLVGISFGGGLAAVAAGRPALRDRLAFVLSFGGHGDLPRVMRYLCTGELPGSRTAPPHDYGVVVILLGVADRMVPDDQVEGLREGILTFLEASHQDMFDRALASRTFARAREIEAELPEPAATFMRYVNTRDVAALGPLLLPHVAALGGSPALSPERSAPPAAPVYLLHGAGDNVIPPIESELLARYLTPSTRVRALITPLITHTEVDRTAGAADVWELIRFWALVMGE
jgi:dienelactone hydrolase